MRPPLLPAAFLLTLALASVTAARAQFVTPTGYTFTPAPNANGGFTYPDSGGRLTDGATGLTFNNYTVPADAPVWVGWFNVSPTISFQFATAQTFSRIEIGTTRSDAAGIFVLTGATVAGSTFTSGITLSDLTRDWLVFDQNFSTTDVGGIPTITISLTSGSQWIMLDEVRFSAIPEPADTAIVISLVALGALVLARQRSRLRTPDSSSGIHAH